jgi:hypothetical protein
MAQPSDLMEFDCACGCGCKGKITLSDFNFDRRHGKHNHYLKGHIYNGYHTPWRRPKPEAKLPIA